VLITIDRTDQHLNLHEAADVLGVHYMTAYRYVRLGELPATRHGGRWVVRRGDVEELRHHLLHRRDAPSGAGRRRPHVLRDRLLRFLVAGDEPGAWSVVERALTTGYTPSQLYLDLLAPALRTVGERWSSGALTVGDEHTVTAVATRLIGRLGPRFVRRGRKHGTVVVGGAPGDPHALGVAMLADLLRAHGYRVVDLGANVPVRSFVDAVEHAERLVAVGVSVSDSALVPAAAEVVAAVGERTDRPVLIGGSVTDQATAAAVGAAGWAPDGEAAAALIERLTAARR
jgi:excisionase family DNA binding protein